MREWLLSLGPVEWFRDQFAECPEGALDCDSIGAPDLFRFVLIAWAVAAVALIALDRLGSGLFGRSRPLAQEPPAKARAWRWGRQAPPENYSLLPPGTTVQQSEPPPVLAMAPVDRPALTTSTPDQPAQSLSSVALPGGEVSNDAFWKALAVSSAPLFGLENQERLNSGLHPERYNPVTGRVETLDRDEMGQISWAWSPESTTVIGDESETSDLSLVEPSVGSSVFAEEEE